ncbi:hypothetical protein N9O88_00715 [bacterium]|nr:hypothetical protein [bacterium]
MPVVTRSGYNKNKEAKKLNIIILENCKIEQNCAICHECIYGKFVYHLPCGHIFHKNCFENQIKSMSNWSKKCSLCRLDLEDHINKDNNLKNLINIKTFQSQQEVVTSNIEYPQEEYWEHDQNFLDWYNFFQYNIIEEESSTEEIESLPDLIVEDENVILNGESLLEIFENEYEQHINSDEENSEDDDSSDHD